MKQHVFISRSVIPERYRPKPARFVTANNISELKRTIIFILVMPCTYTCLANEVPSFESLTSCASSTSGHQRQFSCPTTETTVVVLNLLLPEERRTRQFLIWMGRGWWVVGRQARVKGWSSYENVMYTTGALERAFICDCGNVTWRRGQITGVPETHLLVVILLRRRAL